MKIKIFPIFFLLVSLLFFTGARFNIDAEKNAIYHNNMGLLYLEEDYYFGAIKEFQMAISLNPHNQTTAVYYSNLGDVYMKIQYPNLAQTCYEQAISQNPMQFNYYVNLVESFKAQKILDKKLRQYKLKKNNPLNNIVIGLILIQKGDVTQGVVKLDEFCIIEPDLIITSAVRKYIKQYTKDSFLF